PLLLLAFIEVAPVEHFPRQLNLSVYNLIGLVETFPVECGTQNGVMPGSSVPRLPKGSQFQVAIQGAAELLKIDCRLRSRQAVKEHALLQGRQLVNIFYQFL